MRNLIFLLIGLATALPFLSGQQNSSTSISLDLDKINSIGLAINAAVTVTEGNNQKIKIEGPGYLINDINTEVRDGSWNIEFNDKSNDKSNQQIKIEIQIKSLSKLAVSGHGTIRSKGKFSNVQKRHIAISGSGNIFFQGDAENLYLAVSGVGEIESEGQAENMYVALSGSGDFKLKGKTTFLQLSASGSGDIDGRELKAKECRVSISGSSVVSADVSDEVDLTVSGSGTFKYSGNPRIRKNTDSNSSIQKI